MSKPKPFLSDLLISKIVEAVDDNPRKVFRHIEELAADIKGKGVEVPLSVRPLDSGDFELVDGARRFRAAKLAGLRQVPVLIEHMTDDEAAERRLRSFDLKEDLSAVERAAGYQARLDAGVSIDKLAATVGKSTSTIRGCLLLNRMPAKLREAVESGLVPESTAKVVCRVHGEETRTKIASFVVDGVDANQHLWDNPDLVKEYDKAGEPLTLRATAELIESFCQIELKSAPFPRKALNLVPGVPSCQECPKRAGNDPDLVAAGVRADICTDPECYRAKLAANAERVKVEATKSGKMVLHAKEAEEIFNTIGNLNYNAPYLDLENRCHEDDKQRTYRQILKPQIAAGVVDVVVAFDANGRTHELVSRSEGENCLRRDHRIEMRSQVNGQSGPKSAEEKKEEAKRREQAKLERELDHARLGRVATKAKEEFVAFLPGPDSSLGAQATVNQLLRVTARWILSKCWGSRRDEILSRRQCKGKSATERMELLEEKIGAMNGPEIMGLITEVVYAHVDRQPDGKLLEAMLGIKRAEIEREVKDRLKAEKTAGKAVKKPIGPLPVPSAARKTKAAAKPAVAACRVCGCTDDNCRQCIKKTGHPCWWVEDDLCSACLPQDSGIAKGIKKAEAERVTVTRDTPLADLLSGKNAPADSRALDAWDAGPTVGKLLERCGPGKKGYSKSSTLYMYLKSDIRGLSLAGALQIGDALVDARLLGEPT